MQFLYYLESIRTPFWDAVMGAVTHLGEETVFLVLSVIVLWCVNKRHGYYLLLISQVGMVFNQFLKMICCVPRPWVRDPNFTIVESAREQAIGYSFPSGHTQNVVDIFGGIARFTRHKWLRWTLCALAAIVCFSRMYLGVHTPADVALSILLALTLVFGLYPLMEKTEQRPHLMSCLLMGGVLLYVLLLAYLYTAGAPCPPEDVNYVNYTTALDVGRKLLGGSLGLLMASLVDKRYINFETEAVWWAQVLKVAVGLVLVLAVKAGLKTPLQILLSDWGDSIRYLLVVFVAAAVWPSTFRWWRKAGQKK